MSRRATLGLLGVAAAVVLAGCGQAGTGAAAPAKAATAGGNAVPVVVAEPQERLPATLTDATGSQVTVASADRIVSLVGGVSETLVAMGLGDRIVGRDVSADFAQATSIPLVTQGHDVSAEGVLALQPTLVFTDARSGPAEALAAIAAAGIAVVQVPEVWSLTEMAARTRMVAAAVGAPEAGEAVQRREDRDVARAARGVVGTPTVAFLYLRGTAAVYLLGGDGSGADSLIEAVGGVDAGSKAGLGAFTPLTPEALARAAPDVLLVMDKGLTSVGGVDGLLALPGIAQTPAGRQRRVVSIPDGQLLNFGPRTGDTLRLLAEGLA